jgi:transposase
LVSSEEIIGLPGFEVTAIERTSRGVKISARYTGPISCPACSGTRLRSKGRYTRVVRHESWGTRNTCLELEARKWLCLGCGKGFRQRFPGIRLHQRATEPLHREVFQHHWDGICRSRLARRLGIGGATVERWFQHHLRRLCAERSGAECPRVLGIDEHFFTRKKGYATTFCDLEKHRVFDVVLGRSEASLESYLKALKGKHRVRVVCMDLSSTYRAIVKKHFPNARIVADRFHVIRLVAHHFLACWKDLDPIGSRNRGLLSLLRRHRRNLNPAQQDKLRTYFTAQPAVGAVWRFKEHLTALLTRKHRTRRQCRHLAPRFLRAIEALKNSAFASLVTLGETMHSWAAEIAVMWRFTRNNGITEGFHTKMEALSRQAYGFRNFNNYRQRVRIMCSGI